MKNIIKRPSLAEVLNYENGDVVYRFVKTYGVSQEESEDLFMQVKKWLWLANERHCDKLDGGLSIDHPIVVIDEMWHNFVLFTKDYTTFCKDYFGYYLHHAPATEIEETEFKNNLKKVTKSERYKYRMDQKRPQYEYIYDKLGKETFLKWYHEYPRKYSFQQLAEMHVKALEKLVLITPPKESEQNIETAPAA